MVTTPVTGSTMERRGRYRMYGSARPSSRTTTAGARTLTAAAMSAAVRFLSVEPLLGPLPGLNLEDIDWVIVGGESGPRHRRLDLGWVRDIRDRCVTERIPFFFKQVGGVRPKSGGRLLDGRTWDEMPTPSGAICSPPLSHRSAGPPDSRPIPGHQ